MLPRPQSREWRCHSRSLRPRIARAHPIATAKRQSDSSSKSSLQNEGTRPLTAKPSASVVKLGGVLMAAKNPPWVVSDELWELVERLIPTKQRRARYPGRRRLSDREALSGILFVLHTGTPWMHLPPELGYGSGWTCWRRLDEWQQAGVWERLHALLLTRLRAAGEIDWSRAVIDSSHIQAKKGAPQRARAQSTGAGQDRSITSSSTRAGSRSPTR